MTHESELLLHTMEQEWKIELLQEELPVDPECDEGREFLRQLDQEEYQDQN